MWRLVAAQVWRRRGRSLAVVAAIVVAAVSFSLLTAAVSTSQLQVHGTIQANYRSAYDILVRPDGARSSLERRQGLVQPSFLADIHGGITMEQYHTIKQMENVSVAAPVAMIGYMIPFVEPPLPVRDYIDRQGPSQLLRITATATGDNGLSRYPTPPHYVYVDTQPHSEDDVAGQDSDCMAFFGRRGSPTSPWDMTHQTGLLCYYTNPAPKKQQITDTVTYYYPVLVAAIDPSAEAKLVGLDEAMVHGRYLRKSDRTTLVGSTSTGDTVPADSPKAIRYHHRVPVLVPNRPMTNAGLDIRIQKLHVPHPARIDQQLRDQHPVQWLQSLQGTTVWTGQISDRTTYQRMLSAYRSPDNVLNATYWSVGPVTYQQKPNGHLQPSPRPRPPGDTWRLPGSSYYIGAPQAVRDVAFRTVQQHAASNQYTSNNTAKSPRLDIVGTFAPDKIEGFSKLSRVPLALYYPPQVQPGDARTARLLDHQPLRPDHNIAGYLQQPPTLLTTIKSLHSFTDTQAFTNVKQFAKAPISAIRVRISGVTGVDPHSMALLEHVAAQIHQRTGLDVDVTVGTSPTPKLIDLPAGNFGRPALTLREGWVKKGAAVDIVSAIDTKSLAMFGLVLLACLCFLLNAVVAAVRVRRQELGVLACLGWPARRIFALLEAEQILTGLIAGLLGTGLGVGLVTLTGWHHSWLQLALITPVAMLLAGLAGLVPAWTASHGTPLAATTPTVRNVGRPGRVTSILGLARAGLLRLPGRTALGAASLFLGVAALTVLITLQQSFHGDVVGTALGDYVAVHVRAVDYAAAGLTIGLGAAAVADVAYLNIKERTTELAVLQSLGWSRRDLRTLLGAEGLFTALTGAVLGAALALTLTATLLPVPITTGGAVATLAAAAGTLTATLALLAPLSRLGRIAPATAIQDQ